MHAARIAVNQHLAAQQHIVLKAGLAEDEALAVSTHKTHRSLLASVCCSAPLMSASPCTSAPSLSTSTPRPQQPVHVCCTGADAVSSCWISW
jgi:hypothetical protein